MSQYYGESQWPGAGAGQPTWDHQTPPPARSGASSAIPREEPAAFSQQIEEVDRAIDNLVKSGKMFGGGGMQPRHGRGASGQVGPRPGPGPGPVPGHGVEFGDARVAGAPGPGLQNFYAAQRHQTSRGSNEAEQMMQAKRRMAAQRERELRNYHQEQQYNRTVLAEMTYPGKPERALSPGSMSEDDRRELIARQRSALYGEGPFGENGGYVDESGATRPGAPGRSGSATHRGPSPLTYEYGRPAPPEGAPQQHENQASRADSNASPQSNPPANKSPFDNTIQQANRTSNSSPGGSPPRQGGSNPSGNAVAPIGTRPSVAAQAPNPALNKRSTPPIPSPLSHGYSATGNAEESAKNASTTGPSSNSPSAAPDGYNGWGNRPGVWGKQPSGLGVQASVWG